MPSITIRTNHNRTEKACHKDFSWVQLPPIHRDLYVLLTRRFFVFTVRYVRLDIWCNEIWEGFDEINKGLGKPLLAQ